MEFQNTSSGYKYSLDKIQSTESEMSKLIVSEKLAQFNREKIPERITHAKGSGAFGEFITTHELKEFTTANIFSSVGKKTKVFVRFSNYKGEKGSPDTIRDPKGFAIKFYTEEGNWDIAGNNIPIFFIRDAFKLPDLIHSQRRNPASNLYSNNSLWDFYSLNPETIHAILMNYSDRGIPKSYRNMDGFSCHAFSFINSLNEVSFVKFHFKTEQGIENLSSEEAVKISSSNPDFYSEDLFNSIEEENFPSWKLYVQIATAKDLEKFDLDPFDVTKVWQHKLIPEIEIGHLVLNENPKNYFTEVEQAAFSPGNLVNGIGLSPDKLLKARIFAYPDAQRHRIGSNYNSLEINKPINEIKNNYRDGSMRFDSNGKDSINYSPNSYSDMEHKVFTDNPLLKQEQKNKIYSMNEYSQAILLFKKFTEDKKEILIENILNSLKDVNLNILKRQLVHFYRIDEHFAFQISDSLGINFEEIKKIAKLTDGEIFKITSIKENEHEFLGKSL